MYIMGITTHNMEATMSRLSVLLSRRDSIIREFSGYSLALAGNLGRSQVPPHTGKFYWRVTWKEKQKTVVQYVRPEELAAVKDGVRQFALLRKAVLRLGEINRAIIVQRRRVSGSER
jgi:hypothetical protein